MKKYLATVIAFLFLFGASGGNSGTSSVPSGASNPSIVIFDGWWGTRYTHDYHSCDAVAAIFITGTYDSWPTEDGMFVSLGLSAPNAKIQINVDGTHHNCP